MSEERLSSALIAISNGVGVNKFGDPRDIADKVVAKFKSERDRADKAEANFESLLGDIKRAAGVFLDGAEGGGEFDCLLDRVDAAIIRAESGRVTS